MTLGELKAELKQHGIRVVGTLKNDSDGGGVVIFFSSDQRIVFPFRPKNIYPLPIKSADDGTLVNREKVEALRRALIPNSHDEA
jgi:hypothetical protein